VQQTLAVIVGLVAGTALAVAVALPLRRRLRRSGHAGDRVRRLPLQSVDARRRAAVIAAIMAVGATFAAVAGRTDWASILVMGVVVLATQSVTAVIAERAHGRTH